MKNTFDFKVITLLLAITILFASCKKGDTGATGATGATGPVGPSGSDGPKGDTGTANVIYSAWLNVGFDPITSQNGDTLRYSADISAAKLDTGILSNGEIKVYLNLGTASDPYVVPVPYIDASAGISITPSFLLQDISLSSNVDESTVTDSGNTYNQYRYILIPGGTSGRRMQPNWKDYNAVKEFYHIQN